MASEETARLRITQNRSIIGHKKNQKRTMVALGLKKIHQSVEHSDTPQLRGMIKTVAHLVTVEDI